MSLSPQMLATTPGARLAEALAELERGTFRAHRTAGQVGPGSIQTSFIQTGAITADLVAAGAIIAGKLAVGSVVAGNIAAGAVTVGTLAAGAVTAGSIEAGSITTEKLAAAAVVADKIQAGAVTTDKLAANSVTAGKILAGEVTTTHLAANSVTAAKILAGEISTGHLAAGAVTAVKIQAGSITGDRLMAGDITGDRMALGTLTGDRIQIGTIGAAHLAADSVTAVKIAGGAIDGKTITGALVRSSAAGQRYEADGSGIRGYNAAGEITLHWDNAAGRITALAGLGGVNLLKDSSFESADTSNWFVYDAGSAGVAHTRNLAYGRRPLSKGLQVQRLSGSATHAGVIQSVADKIRFGQTYVHSAWFVAPAGVDVVLFVDDFGGAPGYLYSAISAVATGDWQRLSVAHTPTPGNTSSNVYVWRQNCPINGWLYVDDVQFEEGSLPTPYGPRPDEILPNAVGATEIAPGGVTGGGGTGEIGTGTIIGTDLVVDTITAAQINAGAIGTAELAANAVTAGKILAGEVTTAALAAGAVTAVKVAAGVITADHLTVGAVATSAILNGGFEVPAAAEATRPAHWNRGTIYGASPGTVYTSTAAAQSGSVGLRIVPGAGAAADITSDPVPANPGEVWTLTLWARTTGTNAGTSPGAYAGVFGTWLGGGSLTHLAWCALDNTTVPSTWTRYSGQVTVPAGYAHLTVDLLSYVGNTGATLEIDDVELSKAAIATNISPGAIDAMTITGPTIRTAASGARVEISGTAPIGLKKYDASGNVTLGIGQADGLDLLAADDVTPQTDRKISWLIPGTGAEGGSVHLGRYYDGGLGSYYVKAALTSREQDTTDWTIAALDAVNSSGTFRAQLIAQEDNTGYATAYAQAGTHGRKIIGSDGTSAFQLAASDAALKDDVAALEPGALERIYGLRPVAFRWREGEGPAGPTAGFIAQEVAPVIRGAVHGAEGQLGIQHGPLLAHVVAAIHELADQAVERPTLEETRDLVIAATQPLAERVAALEHAAGDARLPT